MIHLDGITVLPFYAREERAHFVLIDLHLFFAAPADQRMARLEAGCFINHTPTIHLRGYSQVPFA